MPTKCWRMSLTLTPEIEEAVVELRKTEKYCRMSYSEIIRRLIEAGLESVEEVDSVEV